MAIAGGLLRVLTTLLYVLAFCCAVIILGKTMECASMKSL